MKFLKANIITFVLLVLNFNTALPDYNYRIDKSNQINIYKLEIERYENSILNNNISINSLSQKIREYEEKIKSIFELINSFDNAKNQGIDFLKHEKNILDSKDKLLKLKEEFKKRILWLYKFGSDYSLQLLLTSGSVNEFYSRLQYLNKFSSARKNDFDKIKFEEYILNEKKKISKLRKSQIDRYLTSKKIDQEDIIYKKNMLEDSVKYLNDLNDNYQRQIFRIKGLISVIELQLNNTAENYIYKINNTIDYSSSDFNTLKGKLIFPVESIDIISDFGKSVNQSTLTVTYNNGIDVSISKGSDVYCIADGEVEDVLFLPVFGRTVIINHGNNFRSVYGIIKEIRFNKGDKIKAGSVLAKTDANINGQSFHFELWKDLQALDPKQWIRKGQMIYFK